MRKPRPSIRIRREWCKGCSICVEFCPKDVLTMEGDFPVVVDIEACTECRLCEIICPDFAILLERSIREREGTKYGARRASAE